MSTSTTNAEVLESGPQLTHMTKGRARGPRRKAPADAPVVSSVISDEPKEIQQKVVVPPESPIKSPNNSSNVADLAKLSNPSKSMELAQTPTSQADIENSVSQPSSPRKLDMKRRSQFLQEVPNKNNKTEPQLDSPKPLSPTKKANPVEIPLVMSAPTPILDPLPPTRAKPDAPPKSPATNSKASEKLASTMEPFKPDSPVRPLQYSPLLSKPKALPERSPVMKSDELNGARPQSLKSVKNITAQWDRPSDVSPQRSPRTRSPIRLPTHEDEKANMVAAGLRPASPAKGVAPIGLGIETKEPSTPRPLPVPPTKSTISSPRSPGLQASKSPRIQDSLVPQASEASIMLGDFFGEHTTPPEFRADTAGILATRPDQGTNIKTLRSALYQLSVDGKKQLVPSHQERILFEGNFYICSHTFGNTAGKKITEVYYWVGDEVPASTAGEAEIFAQKEARSAGAKLLTIRQGHETPEFFHALGGILIIRRGTSNKYDSLAPHILCGRKHFGQIAFDEVDFSAQSLCSGFPYLISTQSGKSYLWKGKGSGIDELSCARLIGMDFGLTGEIEEVEDGNEPASFLKIFDGEIPSSADHWKMKPNYNKYCSRLFCAESTAKEQIVELNPFCQADLSSSKIYVLDAFFEVYIIVGSRAQSQYSAFQIALAFAQEYGMLAAGMEDRPFIPVSTVVIEGVPRDLKSVFRKWKDGLSPTRMQKPSPGGLRRGRSLRVVPLNAAIEATR
ncbi:Advillin [Lachnellula suecica]|uniref:Advillin n=1 Tax=Lachnellula suecica TaxID=602035 RepID=A0A8T9CD19_9HELO|nr:Advillin [Lachnellula suecica]